MFSSLSVGYEFVYVINSKHENTYNILDMLLR